MVVAIVGAVGSVATVGEENDAIEEPIMFLAVTLN